MGFCLVFLTGVAAEWFFHRYRTAELRRANAALMAENEMLRRRQREIGVALAVIKHRAEQARRVIQIGDSVALAPVAESGSGPAVNQSLVYLLKKSF